jgi:hypothetical protein
MARAKSRKTTKKSKGKSSAGGSSSGGKKRSDPPPKLEHVLSASELAIHKKKAKSNKTEGGACLCMHAGYPTRYAEHTCSYRWQCHEKAKKRDVAVFDTPSDALIGAGKYHTDASKNPETDEIFPWDYFTKINSPSKTGDWHLKGPLRDDYVHHHRVKLPRGKNFTKWIWPYWHNSHHMIPKSLFWSYVSGGEDPKANPETYATMRTALMEAAYNIHHGENMIFSPMDEDVAAGLNLPRHLDRIAMRDHPKYKARVEKRLIEVIDDYKGLCEPKKKKKHPDPKPKLSKAKLEKLSRDCRTEIIRLGKRSPGAPLDRARAI